MRNDRIPTRKPRHRTYLSARLRYDHGWVDVVICNVSERGMMLKGQGLPRRGTFVEIVVDNLVLAGQVRWARLNRCGIGSRERIDVGLLLGTGLNTARPQLGSPKATLKIPTEDLAARAKWQARAIQFLLTSSFVLAGAVLIASTVCDLLAHPMQQVSSKLDDQYR